METKNREKKKWSIGKSIGTIILILSLFGGIAAAIPIDKTKTLGPYDSGHRYYIHIYNVDDIAKASVNGNLIAQTNYYQDSGWIDITGKLTNGANTIEFTNENTVGGWTYGFELRQDNSNVIWQEFCGTVGTAGCINNDGTQGLVYRNIITLTISTASTMLGVDLSSSVPSQQNFKNLKNDPKNYQFVIVESRANLGIKINAKNNLMNARLAGFKTASYIYLNFDKNYKPDIETQTQEAINNIQDEKNNINFMALDIEYDYCSYSTKTGYVCPNLLDRKIAIDQLHKAINLLVKNNIKPVIYSSNHYWTDIFKWNDITEFSNTPLWDSRYDYNPDLKVNWKPYGGWQARTGKQYQGTTTIYSIGVDLNSFDSSIFGTIPPIPTTRAYTFATTGNAMPITIDGVAQISPYTVQWADGTTHSVTVPTGQPQYTFNAWSGKSTSTSTSISITSGATTYGSYTANYQAISTPITRTYTFQTTGNAVPIIVDGTSRNSPYTVQWIDGTTHSVTVSSNQAIVSGKSQYAFTSWSGKSTSTSTSISITASATTYGTYTANYNTQYYLTANVEPSSVTSQPGSGWYNSGTSLTLFASASVGSYTFSTWKLDGAAVPGGTLITVLMNAPHTATAVYTNVVTPNPTLSISQASGVQGTTFYYTGNYFTPNGVTEWHVRKPDGNEYVPYDTAVSANGLGVFNRNWVSSCTSMLGTYTIWAVDKTNDKSSNVVSETVTASASCTNVQYTAQFANTGWMSNWLQNGQTVGTPGGNQMEAIKITTSNYVITYHAHVAFDGWQSWVSNGAIAGTVGQAKSLQAIEIKLLNAPSNLHVYYRVYVHGQGWQAWKYDGQTAGTTGLGLAVDAIEIKIQN